jgi:hypothetical protein
MKKVLVGLLGVALAGSAGAASLAVTNAAALDGTFGLEIQLGSAANAFVEESVAHNAETTYTTRFKINPGTASLTPNTSIRFGAWGATNGAIGQHLLLFLRRDQPGGGIDQYLVNAWGRDEAGPYVFYGSIFHSFVASPLTREYEMQWNASDPAGSNNGNWTLLRVDNPGPTTRTQVNKDYDFDITNVRIGSLNNQGSNGTGNVYFDSFSAFR